MPFSFPTALRPSLLVVSMLLLLNQVTHANQCKEQPERTFDPVVKWEWTGSDVLPEYNQVVNTPIVVPLEDTNNDGQINELDTPAVIFNSYPYKEPNTGAVLRAIRGSDGSEIWSITNPEYRTLARRAVLAADIDEDGIVEIMAISELPGNYLLAFEHSGELKWKKPIKSSNPSGVAANINMDAIPEMIFYSALVNNNGDTLQQLPNVDNIAKYWSIPIVADINLDGQPEVISGGSVYSITGELMWQLMVDGVHVHTRFSAIGNFDADDYPELVLIQRTGGRVFMVSHAGEVMWQQTVPGRSTNGTNYKGGPPVVADMDGDGEAEIGIAGGDQYVVFNADGSTLWTSATKDWSSAATGSSVFDFDGDGKAEVVYSDEEQLRVFDGTTGNVLFSMPNTSRTLEELPVIADVDNDGHVDIVVVANNDLIASGNFGVRVFQDRNNSWVNTRKIWNQHGYKVTNINDDGTVPTIEQPSWLVHNLFRAQIPLPDPICNNEPKTCLLYGLQDSGLNNSQLFTINPQKDFAVQSLGALYIGYDIEGMTIHPKNYDLYLSSGNNTASGLPKGMLYKASRLYGTILPIGKTGFGEVSALAFRQHEGEITLWGWADRRGLITIDPTTGKAKLDKTFPYSIEEMVWSFDGNIIYAAENQTLYAYDYESSTLHIQCDSFPAEVEALELLENGKLLFATHPDTDTYLHLFNLDTCEIEIAQHIQTNYDDVEGLVWTCP